MFSFFKKKKKEEIVEEEILDNEEPLLDDKKINQPNNTEAKDLKEVIEENTIDNSEPSITEEIAEVKVIKEVVQQKQIADELPKKSFFAKALEKTIGNLSSIIPKKLEKIQFDIIEELLIESDMEYEIVEKAMDGLPDMITRSQLRHRLVMLFEHAPNVDMSNLPKPFIQLIIGVNGAGKTTTIAKLASRYKNQNKSVLLGAGDTFRAAAIEQLSIWASKIDVPIIKTQQGHDPSAVAYDTISSAIAKDIDHCIIDTAGRLQTQTNLNKELQKIVKVCNKAQEGAPHQKLLILDGTQGNTAIAQAKAFHEMVNVDGIIVTKLDGTSKGGALFSVSNQLELPIFYIGVGESKEDLIPFSPDEFVDSLLDGIYL